MGSLATVMASSTLNKMNVPIRGVTWSYLHFERITLADEKELVDGAGRGLSRKTTKGLWQSFT